MRRILLCAAIFIIYCSLFISPAGAQGLPLIRNYTAAEYGGHNRNYDVEEGEDGTIFVANFEGLLYYDMFAGASFILPASIVLQSVFATARTPCG